MVVTSKCFAFLLLHEFGKALELKTRQVYFICPFPRRLKLEKSLQTCGANMFFRSADVLSEKNPYFGSWTF